MIEYDETIFKFIKEDLLIVNDFLSRECDGFGSLCTRYHSSECKWIEA